MKTDLLKWLNVFHDLADDLVFLTVMVFSHLDEYHRTIV